MSVIRNAYRSGANVRPIGQDCTIEGQGLARRDFCAIVYVKTGSARMIREWHYWTRRFDVVSYPVDEQGTERGQAYRTAFRVIGTLDGIEQLLKRGCVDSWHYEECIRLPQLAQPNDTHGPRLPVSERELLRRATVQELTKTDTTAALQRIGAGHPLQNPVVFKSFVPATPHQAKPD